MADSAQAINTDTRSAAPYPAPAYAWFVMAVLVITSLVSFVDRQILAIVVGPMKQDLGVSDTQIGWLYGVFAVFYAIAGLPIAYLADRKRRTWIIAIGVFVWSIMTMFCGFARTFWQVLLARIGVGVAEATLNPSTMSLVGDYFPRRSIPLALAVFQTGAILGSGLAFIIGGVVLKLVEGADPLVLPIVGALAPWQQTFVYVGAPGIVLAALLLLLREPTRRGGPVPASQPGDLARSFATVGAHYRLHSRALLLHHFGFLALNLLGYAFVFWSVSYFTRVHGENAADASLTFGWIFLIFGPLGSVCAGFATRWVAARGHEDAAIRVGMLGGALAIVSILLVQLMPTASWAYLLYAPALFFINCPFGIANGALTLATPEPIRAQVAAVYMLILAFGMLLGPPIAGFFNDHLFPGDGGVRYSVATLTLVFGAIGLTLLQLARRPFVQTLRTVETSQPTH